MPETATNLQSKFPVFVEKYSGIIQEIEHRGDLTAIIPKDKIREVLLFLKNDPTLHFDFLMDLFGMDYERYPEEQPERFAVIYNLYSSNYHHRLRLKVFLAGPNPEIESVCDIYSAVNWFEREAWDLYGIQFKGHPNLIRILCHHDFVGHPLRKDYPSTGYQRAKTALPSAGL